MNKQYIFLLSFFTTIVFTIVILKKLIPILKNRKIEQKILEIGPSWHKSKEGTPTMGGVGFILATIIAFILSLLLFSKELPKKEIALTVNVLCYGILNAMIGLIDDVAKMKKSKNEGLSAKTKFLFQSIAAILFLISMHYTYGINTILFIPYFGISLDVGVLYYVIAYFLLCGIVNSVNLTDGLDGLASSVALSVGVFFAFIAFTFFDSLALTILAGTIIGSTIGFLIFNLHPAKIFMGDTGSLFLGALIVSAGFVINNPLIVLVYGFVFVLEAFSDILQVGYFKLTKGKRLFKMAPLHHHFEKSGWKEMKIVAVFTIVNTLFCIIAYFGLGEL